MINMKTSKEEAQEQMQPTAADAPEYPYGLTICLDEESMAKLGITELPKVGTQMQITALVTVCSTSQYSTQGGEDESNLSLQITDMEISGTPRKDTTAVLYGNSGGANS